VTAGDADVVRKALDWMAHYPMTGTEMTLHIDMQGKAREVLPALDRLVARVEELERENARLRSDKDERDNHTADEEAA